MNTSNPTFYSYYINSSTHTADGAYGLGGGGGRVGLKCDGSGQSSLIADNFIDGRLKNGYMASKSKAYALWLMADGPRNIVGVTLL